jgi:tetratricopeptide (TPR) repeat protein
LRTHDEEDALRARAIAALAPVATLAPDLVLLARLRGDDAAAHGDWAAATTAYETALASDPDDRAALAGAAYAAAERHDEARVAQLDARRVALAPTYAGEIAVARAEAQLGDRSAAFAALDRAIALADTPAHRAWTHLYGGRAAVQLHDTKRARAEFTAAQTAAEAIPPRDSRYAMYLEEAQEALVALDLGVRDKPGIVLAPWTGPELPGSLASTLKYRVVVTAAPGAHVQLAARGLPAGWVGSFCSDRLCSPFRVMVVIPASGVKIVEFQVIPGDHAASAPRVHIDASQGSATPAVSASMTVAAR